jgi:glutathione S-transferase
MYSFRRCPYAMRARLALRYAGIQVELREVVLRDKPQHMLDVSPKGEVPVLLLDDGRVIDESLDIILWALEQNDQDDWQLKNASSTPPVLEQMRDLIAQNDNVFKQHLDHYKYADRFPEHPLEYYRQQGEDFLAQLETRLASSPYLFAEHVSIADVSIFPFVRQFAFVDKHWFDNSHYTHLQNWLEGWLQSPLFLSVMKKYAQWKPDADEKILF